jgi:hypothetical protein
VSSWWPGTLAASQKMQMQVHDKLSSLLSIIDDQSVPVLKFLLFGDLGCCQHQLSEDGLVSLFSMFDHVESIFLFRNDQNMDWGLGSDVSKCQDMIVFVDNACGNLLSDDFVKDCFVAHFDRIRYFS